MKSKNFLILLSALGSLTISSLVQGLTNNNSTNDSFVQSDSGINKNETIRAMLNDKEGNFWVGTESSKIYERVAGSQSFKSIEIDGIRPDVWIHFIFEDSSKTIWIGAQHGLFFKKLNEKTFSEWKAGLDNIDAEFSSIFQDKDGNLWVSDLYQQNMLYKLELGGDKFVISPNNAKPAAEIMQDKAGTIWMIDAEGHLFTSTDVSNFVAFDNGEGASISVVSKLYSDSSNNIWIATGQGMYEKPANEAVFSLTDVKYAIADSRGGSPMISEDAQKDLWVVTDSNGIFEKKHGTNTFAQFAKGLPTNPNDPKANKTTCVIEDKYGYIWVGTEGLGAYVSNFKIPKAGSELSTGAIIGIVIGSIAGVALIGGGTYFYMNKSKTSKTEASKK